MKTKLHFDSQERCLADIRVSIQQQRIKFVLKLTHNSDKLYPTKHTQEPYF